MQILIIEEDEKKVAEALKTGLESEHYDVRVAHGGEEGFFLAADKIFDLIILDLMLPGRDGLEILTTLRKRGMYTRVLILTAKDAVEDRVSGLDVGADDYLVKPFAYAELSARVRVLLRRGRSDEVLRLKCGDLEMDLIGHVVERAGHPIQLTSREFELLDYLLRHQGRVVSRETLARDVWQETNRATPLDNGIDVHVARLRRKVDVLAGRVFEPVGEMVSKAADITADRLSERLPDANPEHEFGRLATVFNDTLARLESSFENLRRFTADASHQTRTPLTSLRSVGEVGMQAHDRSPAFYRDVIGSMLEEADRLARLVDNLLTLTRADAGQVAAMRERVDLVALAQNAIDHIRVLAEEKNQEIGLEGESALLVETARQRLWQALLNVLDNAIKYTLPDGRVSVAVRRRSTSEAVIEVSDSCP